MPPREDIILAFSSGISDFKIEIKKQKTASMLLVQCRELGNPPGTSEPLIIA